MSDVLAEVEKVLQERAENLSFEIAQGPDDSIENHKQTIARMEKKLAELKDLELKQWDEKIKGTIPSHIFETLNSKTRQEIEDLGHELCILRETIPEAVDLTERLATIHEAIRLLQDPDAPAKETNRFLKACIKEITYYREKKEGARRWGDPNPIQLHFELKI